MNFKRLNTITGWIVFAISLLVYVITMEKTSSFWDCGEFIAAAHKLQIVHPPGAPLYLMLGRLFSFFLPPPLVALGVNFLSALSTAFAALFVFWSTTIFAKRLLINAEDSSEEKGKIYVILGSGIVAAFAFVFQDSQWFNAVEAEVYALSTCLTAAVFWMALKWSENQHQPYSDRWLIAITFVIGLSIGVHLLNLLVIPAIALLIYFYRKPNHSIKGGLIAFFTGIAILLFIQYGVILELPEIGSGFELLFVNQFGLPFGSGMLCLLLIIFAIPVLLISYCIRLNKNLLYAALALIGILAISKFFKVGTLGGTLFKALLIGGIAFAVFYFRDRKSLLYKASLGFLFIMIGYLSYIFVPVRSAANTPIDINNPDNVFSLLSYLNREQYGNRPLLTGPLYDAEPVGTKDVGDVFAKVDNGYQKIDDKIDHEFNSFDKTIFPRAWQYYDEDKQNYYKSWLGIGNKSPSMVDNLKFFFTYQLDFMYWRYFMWNFAGRQNTIQSDGLGDRGNWMSGVPFADNGRIVKSVTKPDTLANNPSVNHFYMVPFVIGLIGLVFHFMFSRKDAFVLSALFLLTGVAIVVYLNQEPQQPRERDYAYVGSFLAYAIWIGLSVAGLYKAARTFVWNDILKVAIWIIGAFSAFFFMGFATNNPQTIFGILLTVLLIFAIVYSITMGIKKMGENQQAVVLFVVAFIAPALMAFQGWDDHNRNQLKLANATGKNYLLSTDENAILFTEGDNDTYPLWYAQEIEHVRPDIRIVNNSLLKGDWYIEQVQQHNGFQPGLDISFERKDYRAGNKEVIYYTGQDMYQSLSLENLLKFIKSDDERTKYRMSSGTVDILPTKTFTMNVNTQKMVENNIITPEEAEKADSVMILQLSEGKNNLVKDEYIIYDLILRYFHERPIYFTSENLPRALGLSPYIKRVGSSYQLTPVLHPDFGTEQYSSFDPQIDKEKTLDFMQNTMLFGNVDSGVYLEETGQRQLLRYFDYSNQMMFDFAENNEDEKAIQTYQILENQFYNTSVPQDDMYIIYGNLSVIESLFMIDQPEEAVKVAKRTVESALRQLEYVNSSNMTVTNEQQILNTMPQMVESIRQMAMEYENDELASWVDERISQYE